MQEEAVLLETLDGVQIDAVVIRSDAQTPRATVVIGHPHPLYGGDRTNHVVRALQQAAWENDCHSVAVNFRGVGMSGGEHDNGDAERLDLAAACELAEMIEPDAHIVMSGYSFGAVVALNVTHPMISSWIGLAAPVSVMGSEPTSRSHHRPKFLFAPEHDQFCSPDQLRTATQDWVNTTVTVVQGVDHFFAIEALETARNAIVMALPR